MSDFVYPRHGCIQELMLKEAAWTAKFIRRQREEEKEEKKKQEKVDKWEQKAEDTIMKFLSTPSPTGKKGVPGRATSPASLRKSPSQTLSTAGAMAVEG
mmetsp:Transcript_4824/g.8596  ORF Transcript_4824/g.8596 Transcript_4824/m.8596 type:complete len:99 (-) Transcript_4824:149-445(-)